MTLPFIHFMSQVEKSKRRYYASKLKFYAKDKDLNKIKRMIEKSGSIEYSEEFMSKISDEAIQELDIFSDSDAKKSLILLVKYNLERFK